jgi:basic amino acid/polyamine antiporter, APA family
VRQLAASTVNNIIGSGIFALPAVVALSLGPSAIVAYVVCGIAIGLVALCFVEAGSRISLTGGAYAYVEAAFGPYAGFLVGALFWFGAQIMSSAAVSSLMVDSVRILAPALPRAPLLVAVYGFLAWINIRGVRPGARLIEVVTVAKVAPLLLLIGAGVFIGHASNLAWQGVPTPGNIGRASLQLIFAFMGMETALTPAAEIKNPARTIPRGLLTGLGIVVVLYSAVQLAAQGILGPDLATNPTAPLAAAAARAFGSGGRLLMLVAAIISTFGYVSGDMLATPRLLFAFSRDGFLPESIGAVHERYRTPWLAIIVHASVACACALSGTFRVLAVLAVLPLLFVYLAVCVAVLRLRHQSDSALRPLIPGLAVVVLVWLIGHSHLREFAAIGAMVILASLAYRFRRVNAVVGQVV